MVDYSKVQDVMAKYAAGGGVFTLDPDEMKARLAAKLAVNPVVATPLSKPNLQQADDGGSSQGLASLSKAIGGGAFNGMFDNLAGTKVGGVADILSQTGNAPVGKTRELLDMLGGLEKASTVQPSFFSRLFGSGIGMAEGGAVKEKSWMETLFGTSEETQANITEAERRKKMTELAIAAAKAGESNQMNLVPTPMGSNIPANIGETLPSSNEALRPSRPPELGQLQADGTGYDLVQPTLSMVENLPAIKSAGTSRNPVAGQYSEATSEPVAQASMVDPQIQEIMSMIAGNLKAQQQPQEFGWAQALQSLGEGMLTSKGDFLDQLSGGVLKASQDKRASESGDPLKQTAQMIDYIKTLAYLNQVSKQEGITPYQAAILALKDEELGLKDQRLQAELSGTLKPNPEVNIFGDKLIKAIESAGNKQ